MWLRKLLAPAFVLAALAATPLAPPTANAQTDPPDPVTIGPECKWIGPILFCW